MTDDPNAPQVVRDRRLSVVMFLNDPSTEPAPDCYGGGALVFYGLLDEANKLAGLPLFGQGGGLVAFLPHVSHAVEAVTHGTRYTIVTWFV